MRASRASDKVASEDVLRHSRSASDRRDKGLRPVPKHKLSKDAINDYPWQEDARILHRFIDT